MNEVAQLAALCEKLGAPPAQAHAMAAQMLKRADQLASERGIERTKALEYLIDLVIKGRAGDTPPAFSPARKPSE